MPHNPADIPEDSRATVLEAFAGYPELEAHCGTLLGAVSRDGLTNRVFLLDAEKGRFFLRLPDAASMVRIDRHAEAHNLELAAGLGLAAPPLVCRPEAGILLTREVADLLADPSGLPEALGCAVARLHTSGAVFSGRLDPVMVCDAQLELLDGNAMLRDAVRPLVDALSRIAAGPGAHTSVDPVPSHGDLSSGNCLMTEERLWLIDWEYSAMAEPAWDLAYASLENGFSKEEERRFLAAYRESGAERLCPSGIELELMKAGCDAVSALWAYGQMGGQAGPAGDRLSLLAFARERRDRALARMNALS